MPSGSICVLGGSGFVGTHLCAGLARTGHRVTILTREPERARHLRVLPAARILRCNVHDAESLASAMAGHDAVVNLVGILNEPGRDGSGFRQVHTDLARTVTRACGRAGVPRLLQMSGLNADAERGPSHYLVSKGLAERYVREAGSQGLRWTIFQPSVIFGRGDSFINRFARLLRWVPFALPLARPQARLAPVWIEDVTGAMLHCLEDEAAVEQTYPLCGPDVFTLREIVCYVRDQLGLRRAIIGLPDAVSRVQAAIMDFVPGKPFSTDNYRSLTQDSVCSVDGFARLGMRPHALHSIVPQYLGLEGGRGLFDRYRRTARR